MFPRTSVFVQNNEYLTITVRFSVDDAGVKWITVSGFFAPSIILHDNYFDDVIHSKGSVRSRCVNI